MPKSYENVTVHGLPEPTLLSGEKNEAFVPAAPVVFRESVLPSAAEVPLTSEETDAEVTDRPALLSATEVAVAWLAFENVVVSTVAAFASALPAARSAATVM